VIPNKPIGSGKPLLGIHIEIIPRNPIENPPYLLMASVSNFYGNLKQIKKGYKKGIIVIIKMFAHNYASHVLSPTITHYRIRHLPLLSLLPDD